MKFILNKDTLEIENIEVVKSGSVNYYEADVEYDKSWNELVIEAVVVKKDEEAGKSIAVINNKMYIDQELRGTYCIGFVGYKIEEEKKVYQISTNLQKVYFDLGAGEIETENVEVPTPTEWELYLAKINEIINGVSDEITNKVLADIQPTLDKNLQDMKEYTDKEIATFDFIKVVSVLPEEGLENRIYFVPKKETQTQDLFDEYVWINNDWEWLTTKQIEIDLTDYQKKSELAEEQFEITYKDGTTKTVRSVVFK